MKEIDFLDAVGRVDKQYIEECITYKPPKKMNVWIKRMSAIAACFLVVISAILIINHMNQAGISDSVIIDENGFYIENGVLLKYTGAETDITIPEEVEIIADYTFLENTNSSKIEVVRLGASVQKVETNAFAGLENLVDIIIAANNLSFVEEDGLIMTSDGSILLHYEREGETKFTIPESVRFVAAHAVQATELEEIDFGNIEYIGYNAFASNRKLKAIYLPDSVKYICEGAFSDCGSAVDGYIPEDVEFGGEAFSGVPFYLTMIAGQMSPLEERVRGLVTPPEEVVKSNLEALEEQIWYTLAALRGETLTPTSESTRRAYTIGTNAPEIPDGMVVPTEFVMSGLTYADGTYVYDLDIHIPAGDYTIVLQATPENMNTALYWEDVVYCILNLFYLQNPETVQQEETVFAFGWTAVFEWDGDTYGDVTFTHKDGRIVHNTLGYRSAVRPTITFSPNGTRAAVEYRHENGQYCFYVIALNRDILMNPNYQYTEYLNRYYGEYVKGSLYWADEDNIEGRNEYGWFRYNIYEYHVTILEEMVMEDPTVIPVAPALSAKANALPAPAEEARIKYSVIGGSPVVYVFDDDMRFYLAYLNADMSIGSVFESTLMLPNGYTNGRIVGAEGGGGSGEFCIYVSAKTGDQTVVLGYLFASGEGALQPHEIIVDNEYTAYFDSMDELSRWLYNTGDADAFPSVPYTIVVFGFDTSVVLEMEGYAKPASITAYDQTLPITEDAWLYGNYTFDLFAAEDAVVFSFGYYNIGHTYILTKDSTQIIAPGIENSIHLYPDDAGNLRYQRINNRIADIIQKGGLSAATGYDDLLYCYGDASIVDGKLVLEDADEYYTISDKYDLDQEFENMYSRYHASIQEVFDSHKLYPGGAIYRPTVFEVLLTMSVADIRSTYGTLTLEYSEHGPGQPVYSMKYLPGVLLVFHNWNMDDPLTDNMIPAELILTENCSRDVRGITVGANIEDRTQTIYWSDLWYHVINGTANLQAEFSGYTATYTISGENLNLPAEDTAHEFDWDTWEEEYNQNPTGRVVEIRIKLNQ